MPCCRSRSSTFGEAAHGVPDGMVVDIAGVWSSRGTRSLCQSHVEIAVLGKAVPRQTHGQS